MAKRPVANHEPTKPPPAPPDELVRVYALFRDEATGCYVDVHADVPRAVVDAGLVHVGEVRHMRACIGMIERDARSRA